MWQNFWRQITINAQSVERVCMCMCVIEICGGMSIWRSMCCQRGHQRCSRTGFSPLSGACLDRQPPRDLQEHTETITAYMRKCRDGVTVSRTISIRANQKSWLTGKVHRLLCCLQSWERGGPKDSQGQAVKGHQRGQEKGTPGGSLPSTQTCNNYSSLLNQLNDFFDRFEAGNTTLAQKTLPPPNDEVLLLSRESVRRSLRRTNARKASGPDHIPGCVPRDCVEELTDVLIDILNSSLSQAVVPTCLKATTSTQSWKKPSPSCYNDYRPAALTPTIIKCFEWLDLRHIK